MTEFDRAMEFARSALAFLKKGRIPPLPHYYELLYTYAAGVNPELNERFNSILAKNPQPTVDLADQLYDEFMRRADLGEHLSKMSTAMSEKIESVHQAIDATMESANAYTGSLESASGDLDDKIDAKALKALTQRLLKETREMQATNQMLESKLNESWEDISALKRDLDEVRRESMLDALTKLSNRKRHRRGCRRGCRW